MNSNTIIKTFNNTNKQKYKRIEYQRQSGPFNRLACVMGHNYMIHHPPHEEYSWFPRGQVSEFNVNLFIEHIKSFLISIGGMN